MKNILLLLALSLGVGCSTFSHPVRPASLNIPVSFGDVAGVTTLQKFEKRIAIRLQTEEALAAEEKEIVIETIRAELAQVPGARGIKNFKLRYYMQSWQSGQLLNVFGWVYGTFAAVAGHVYRTVEVSGEIY